MGQLKYRDFPRKAKKTIKRNFMKTISPDWKSKEVHIKNVRRSRLGEKPEYKSWSVSSYCLGSANMLKPV